MRKTTVTIALISILLFSIVCMPLFASIASADESIRPWDMVYKELPIITINSPSNDTTIFDSTVLLNLTFTKPLYWVSRAGSGTRQMLETFGYELDGKSYGPFTVNSYLEIPLNYYVNLTLDKGIHILRVYENASGWIVSTIGEAPREVQITGWSDTITFTTLPTTPTIDVQPLAINGTSVSLNFTLNEPVSLITYSLDNQDNVSIAGNTTLKALPYGHHNVTVYATNQAGNVGASETVTFTVTEPSEPFPVVLAVAAVVVVIVAVGSGFLLLYRKRQREAGKA